MDTVDTIQRRFWKMTLVLAGAAVLTLLFLYPSKSAPQIRYAENLPFELGDWIGEDLPVSDYEIAILETDDVLMRAYSRPNEQPIVLSVVFAQENRKVAHPPEVCLTGGGWEVEQKSTVLLKDDFKVIRLVTAHGFERELYYYWYKSGDFFTESYLRQQLNIALSHLIRRKASASLIRVSTYVQNDDFNAADARLKEFSLKLLPHVERELP